jgi:thiol-disulfide isomerase/thioredoxin
MLQMSGQFVDRDEQQAWDDDQKEISNITHSFSGKERNRLFLNDHAAQFLDLSGLSGVDSSADGRVFVRLDYDRDGWPDFAVVNSSRPFLQLYRNKLGELSPSTTQAAGKSPSPVNNLIAVRFVGGNVSASSSTRLSHRDGWGAKVLVTLGGEDHKRTLLREHLCGEGMAGQNSSTMLIGIGNASDAEQIEIHWPSGEEQTVPRVAAGSLVTVFENPAASPRDEAHIIEPYRRAAASPPVTPIELAAGVRRFDVSAHSSSELTVVTTMASWCAACAKHQPLLGFLPEAFEKGEVGVVGFPIDREDPAQAVREFVSRHNSTYPLMLDPTVAQRDAIESILGDAAGTDALPSSIVTDTSGRVLVAQSGIPTVSQLRKLLAESRELATRTPNPEGDEAKSGSE